MGAQTLTVDLSKTVGQTSAIEANGSPIFEIRVTCPVQELPPLVDGSPQEPVPGFGVVLGSGPVAGYEVLYTAASVVR